MGQSFSRDIFGLGVQVSLVCASSWGSPYQKLNRAGKVALVVTGLEFRV